MRIAMSMGLLIVASSCKPADPPSSTSAPPSSPAPVAASGPASIASATPQPSSTALAAPPTASAAPVSSVGREGALETGYLIRLADGTCTWNVSEYCCPPRAMCKPSPDPRVVACPPLAPVKEAKPTNDVEPYKERRADGHCWSGPNPRALHRSLCCNEH